MEKEASTLGSALQLGTQGLSISTLPQVRRISDGGDHNSLGLEGVSTRMAPDCDVPLES